LFAQTMAYVAATAGLFALGAFLGRDLDGGVVILAFIPAIGCLIGMHFAVRTSRDLTIGLLGAFGILMGLAVAPTLAYYASADPQALWEAGVATALFIAGFGSAGYATRRDLTALARASFWALLGLIVFGIVLIFVQIPNGALIYSILGLVIFAGLTMYDFQRLRRPERRHNRTTAGRVHLPRHPQRLPALPPDLHQSGRRLSQSPRSPTQEPAEFITRTLGKEIPHPQLCRP
jgi:modulator of FtsH protease